VAERSEVFLAYRFSLFVVQISEADYQKTKISEVFIGIIAYFHQ